MTAIPRGTDTAAVEWLERDYDKPFRFLVKSFEEARQVGLFTVKDDHDCDCDAPQVPLDYLMARSRGEAL